MEVSRTIALTYPEALLLCAAIVWLYTRWRSRRNLWRSFMLLCACGLLILPAVIRQTRSLDVIFVADRSRSISDEGLKRQQELLDLAEGNLQSGDRAALVSFNDKAWIESPLSLEGLPRTFAIASSPDGSDLSGALRMALRLASAGRASRIAIISDGEYTGPDPMRMARDAQARNIPIHFRHIRRGGVFNLMISRAGAPDTVLENETFPVRFHVHSTADIRGRYRLIRNERVSGGAEQGGWIEHNFSAGNNIIAFQDNPGTPGIQAYRLEVESIPPDREKALEDNSAEVYVSVLSEETFLVVNNTGKTDNVSEVLKAAGIRVHVMSFENYNLRARRLAGYRSVILNNAPLLRMTPEQQRDLKNYVTETGGGLLVCGGNRSFGAGGYYTTPVGDILPVSMEDRTHKKRISSAVSIVLDCSGSMSVPTTGGATKMDLANHAAVESLRMLSPGDSISVIAVDSQAHIVVPQRQISNPEAIASEILSIKSMGGGIFVHTGLIAAGLELSKAPQFNKHILLFADAADAEEPGEYKNLLKHFEEAGITVSVVGLGKDNDSDAEFLRDVAARGKGEVYFTEHASQLIQFFAADTMNFTRTSFITDPADMRITAAALAISPDRRWEDFRCGGYNLLFSRDKADVAIHTADEDQSPVLAFWQRGLGRVASLSLDPEGEFKDQPDYAAIVMSTARWIAASDVAENYFVRTEYEGRDAIVSLEIPEAERSGMGTPVLRLLTPKGDTVTAPMTWERQNVLSARVRLDEQGAHQGIIQAGGKNIRTGPVAIAISPEFLREDDPEWGRRILRKMADTTGGREITDLRDLFKREKHTLARRTIEAPLALALLLLFLADLADARFRFSAFFLRKAVALREAAARFRRKPRTPGLASPRETPGPAPEDSKPAPEKPPSDGGLDYLDKTRADVRKRFGPRA